MKLFCDVFTGDELFSDKYTSVEVDHVVIEVFGKHLAAGVDIVLEHKLVQIEFDDKVKFNHCLESYLEKLRKHVEDNKSPDEIEKFNSNINNVVKEMMDKFKDLQFYIGEGGDGSQSNDLCVRIQEC